MKIKIKKLSPESILPSYAKNGDAGMDLTATSISIDEFGCAVFGTGLAIEIPKGYVGLIFPRSSISKFNYTLSNSVGVIDSGYRGEITLKFKPTNHFNIDECINYVECKHYEIGDRVGQLLILPYPLIEFEEVLELNETERGTNGYGSTGI